ncbi:MAG: hypothetical protein GC182_19305 [Rhodopseudomonas sp.]|nr:hypothetical protein [Rhodopseudomonas sp.]
MAIAAERTIERDRGATVLSWLLARPWLLSALLCGPLYLVYACNFMFLPPGSHGTGFLQYDQPYYMANARAYFSDGHFTLTYGLPFSFDPATPKVYFQPLTFGLGAILYLTGADPGYLYMAAGLVIAIACGRVAIACYRDVVTGDDSAAFLGLLCLFWGGGLLALGGIGYGLSTGQSILTSWYRFDPFSGWWLLNLGRNLVYTTEAFYHLIFLGCLICLFRHYYLGAFALTAAMAASHPFTGIELIFVVGAATVWQLYRAPNRAVAWLLAGIALLGALHLFYYLYFLSHVSLDHRLMEPQWHAGRDGVNQPVAAMTTLLSQILIAPFAIMQLLDQWRRDRRLSDRQRVLVAMWAIVFALSHHDWLIAPIQPLHFLRGYDWTALFLIGAPALVASFRKLIDKPRGWIAAFALVILFLFDNIGFVVAQVTVPFRHGNNLGYTVTDAEWQMLRTLRQPRFAGCVVLSDAATLTEAVGSLVVTYTPLRAYYPRYGITPESDKRNREQDAFYRRGLEPDALRSRCVVAIVPASVAASVMPRITGLGYQPVFRNEAFVLARKNAAQGTDRPAAND